MSSRTRTAVAVMIASTALVATLALQGCTSKHATNDDSRHAEPVASSAPRTPGEERWARFAELVDRPPVNLDIRTTPDPPEGFNAADVHALARRATALVRRSFDPRLSRMSGPQAAAYVLDSQYPGTRAQFITEARNALGKSWPYLVASRYEDAPTNPRYLKATWDVRTDTAANTEGQPRPLLQVTLQVVATQTVTDPAGTMRPVLTTRKVTLRGFRPRAGPQWWPALAIGTGVFGAATCPLLTKGLAIPALAGPGFDKRVDEVKKLLESDAMDQYDDDGTRARQFASKRC